MAAVRVPPSAWSTSQSSTTVRSPSAAVSTTARMERPIRRWISCVLPETRPLATSRGVRLAVALGSMEYSAVTHAGDFARRTFGSSPRQHGILGGNPPLAGVAQERRHAVLHAGGAQHLRISYLDQRGTFRGLQVSGHDLHRAHLPELPIIRSHHFVTGESPRIAKYRKSITATKPSSASTTHGNPAF